jgi:uncharacterized membrane protein
MERVPQVRIGEWFNEAWRVIRPVWLEYVLAVLVYYLLMVLAMGCLAVPALIVGGPLTGGLYVYLAKRLLGQPAEVGDIFKGFRRFGDTTVLFLAIQFAPILFIFFISVLWLLPSLLAERAGETGTALAGIGLCTVCCAGFLFVLV